MALEAISADEFGVNACVEIDRALIPFLLGATDSYTNYNEIEGLEADIEATIYALEGFMHNLAKIGSGQGENCSMLPIGSIVMFGGVNIPVGWLLCDESIYDIATYPELAAVLGGNFGYGETQFFTPDLRGRSPLGYGEGVGLTVRDEMGARYGAETHALSIEELAAHNHFDAGHDHDIEAHTHPTQNHTHTQEAHTHTQEAHTQTVAVKTNATAFGTKRIENVRSIAQ